MWEIEEFLGGVDSYNDGVRYRKHYAERVYSVDLTFNGMNVGGVVVARNMKEAIKFIRKMAKMENSKIVIKKIKYDGKVGIKYYLPPYEGFY